MKPQARDPKPFHHASKVLMVAQEPSHDKGTLFGLGYFIRKLGTQKRGKKGITALNPKP